MAHPSKILDLIDALSASRPFTLDSVARLTGAALKVEPSVSNTYFSVFKGAAAQDVTGLELRLPTAESGKKDGLLILDVDPSSCVTQEDVRQRFGGQPQLEVPTPRQPPESPVYLVYDRPWGKLSLGFARPAADCLTAVVFDAVR